MKGDDAAPGCPGSTDRRTALGHWAACVRAPSSPSRGDSSRDLTAVWFKEKKLQAIGALNRLGQEVAHALQKQPQSCARKTLARHTRPSPQPGRVRSGRPNCCLYCQHLRISLLKPTTSSTAAWAQRSHPQQLAGPAGQTGSRKAASRPGDHYSTLSLFNSNLNSKPNWSLRILLAGS